MDVHLLIHWLFFQWHSLCHVDTLGFFSPSTNVEYFTWTLCQVVYFFNRYTIMRTFNNSCFSRWGCWGSKWLNNRPTISERVKADMGFSTGSVCPVLCAIKTVYRALSPFWSRVGKMSKCLWNCNVLLYLLHNFLLLFPISWFLIWFIIIFIALISKLKSSIF